MPKFAANLSWLYTELPFFERFEAAARDGFRAVEFLFPYEHSAVELRSALLANGLEQVLFNAPPGEAGSGERGLASLPERVDAFRASIDQALEYAAVLGCSRLHVMAGLVRDEARRQAQRATYLRNLAWACRRAAGAGVTVLIEPLNPRDMPGYLLRTQADAHAIVAEVGEPNLKVQMDLYHCQIVEGDVSTKIRRHFAGIGHVQIAGVPDRCEPDVGELHYPYLLSLLDELGYDGWVGCEYRPRQGTRDGLGWMRAYARVA
ncbi:MAG TPA: 2-oxo-tetronate isomerase [Zeimonas sp.]|nr:2-oxo-tetronate isomerase [Zeimonas sp.]